MVLKVFSVFDSKAKAYLQPFQAVNSAVALRSFEAAVNDERHDFHRFASDYTLFELGYFDDSTGMIECHDAHVALGTAVEFLKTVAPPTREQLRGV